jgi:ring-1,2-phenylacetyl-CoA epoxidase subunit PaaB
MPPNKPQDNINTPRPLESSRDIESQGTNMNTKIDSNKGNEYADKVPKESYEWPLWEVFVRSKAGLDHKHCGSLHAADTAMAIQLARDVYTRRQEGVSIWVVPSSSIIASDPGQKDSYFDPMADKVYRHPSFYELPAAVDHM